jgi:hypothetical protein
MTNFIELASISSGRPGSSTDQLRLAVAAYLARFKGSSREHTESDLRCYLTWCAGRGLDPLTARRPHVASRAYGYVVSPAQSAAAGVAQMDHSSAQDMPYRVESRPGEGSDFPR